MSLQVPYIQKTSVRGIRNTTESIVSFPNPYILFKNIELGDFCPRRLFEIVFANELTPKCSELLDGIIESHERNKKNSNIVFITRKSIINFIKEVVNNYGDNLEHPTNLLDHLQRTCSDLHYSLRRKEDISRKQLALLMKHKVINEMYTQYASDAQADHEIRQREELLKKLLRLDYQKFKSSVSASDMKGSKSKKITSRVKLQMSDYTLYALPDNLHGSDDLRDNVYFYVFVGFQDPCLIKQLMRYRVRVNCILQIARTEDVETSELTYFWKKIGQITQNAKKSKILEEAAQMKYVHKDEIPDDEDQRSIFFETRLSELGELLMNILDLKRKHIHYIKHLHPYKFKSMELNYGPFSTYEYNLKDIPSEFITIPYIIHSMLLEVEKTFEEVEQDIYQDPTFKNLSSSTQNLRPDEEIEKIQPNRKKPCPFTLEYFRRKQPEKVHLKKRKFRKFYEGDFLNLNMYLAETKKAKIVPLCDSKTLMNQRFFHVIKSLKTHVDMDSFLPHIHHQGIPSSQQSVLSQEQTNYFLNLLYLNSMKIIEKNTITHENPARKFLCDPYDFFENRNYLPKSTKILKDSNNLYSKFDGMLFRWKEPLSMSTLAQWLFQTQQEFSQVDYEYCESTHTLVVHFHQNLESSGTCSKIWKESLRTLTCFRDFCDFYIFQEAGWFSKFQPTNYIDFRTYIKNEEKYVFERLIESNTHYKEYEKYLIPYYFCDNFDIGDDTCPLSSEITKKFSHITAVMQPNFEDVISELKNYPCSGELLKNCAKSFSTSSLTAYNEKSSRCGLTGATHDFFSHDGVQVTIDTCRFHFEDFKLSMTIKFDGHSLICHYKNRQLDPHVVLKDGTVITIIFPPPKPLKDDDSCIQSDDIDILKSILGFNLKKFLDDAEMFTQQNLNFDEFPKFRPEVKHVVPVHNEHLDRLELDRSLIWKKTKKRPHEKNVSQDIKILKQMSNTNVFYKYVDSRKLKYTRRKYRVLEIPYSSVIRRILTKPMKQKCTTMLHRRKLRPKYYRKLPNAQEKDSIRVNLSLPNGLTLQSFTSKENKDIIILKQTHLERHRFETIKFEDYRLYLDNGRVLIRFTNGNIKILDAQGVIVEFKQDQKDDCDEKKCCQSIENCRKMMHKISSTNKRICHDLQDFRRSRRGHLTMSKTLKVNVDYLKALVPLHSLYSNIQMYTSDGYLLKLKQQNITKKTFAKVLKDWDLQTGEIFLNRTDGMKILNKNNGDQIVLYQDGTKIRKTVHIEKQLEFFTNVDKEGWVVIHHTYLYEHPLYCPIEFESSTNRSTVLLKRNIKLILSKSFNFIDFRSNCKLTISQENMCLVKSCPKCEAECICEIKVDGRAVSEKSSQLLFCTDSYKKEFTSDFLGRCQINRDFIKGELNCKNCNHVRKRDYHRAFLINEDMTGDLLWNDNMIMNELEKMEDLLDENPPKVNVQQFTDTCSNSIGISFTKNYYQSLKSKFLWAEYLEPFVYPMLKKELKSERKVEYQVCRKIFNILREKETNDLHFLVKKLLEFVKGQV